MTVAFAPVAFLASATVLKTGNPGGRACRERQAALARCSHTAPRCVLPPFFGVTPPTILVPYAIACAQPLAPRR